MAVGEGMNFGSGFNVRTLGRYLSENNECS